MRLLKVLWPAKAVNHICVYDPDISPLRPKALFMDFI